MHRTIHILIPDEDSAAAEPLIQALQHAGLSVSRASIPSACDIMVIWRSLDVESLAEAQTMGTLLISAGKVNIDALPSLVVNCAKAFHGTVEVTDGLNISGAERLSIEQIDELVGRLSDEDVLEQINLFLATTQRLSAPLIKAGQLDTCLVVCRHAAYSLLELLRAAEVEDGAADVVQAIADAVSSTVLETEDGSIDVEQSVDRLNDCFVQLSLGLQTAAALTVVEETFSDVLGSGRDANAALLYEVIKLSLDQGQPLLESTHYSWCGHIYLLATRNLAQLLGAIRTNEDAVLTFARERLEPFSELDHDTIEYDADVLVPALHETLIDILEHAEEARRWAYDS